MQRNTNNLFLMANVICCAPCVIPNLRITKLSLILGCSYISAFFNFKKLNFIYKLFELCS